MIAKTKLEEIQDRLSQEFEKVTLRGHGLAVFLHLAHKDRAVEISQNERSFWLEFWEKGGNLEDDPRTMNVDTCEQVLQETRKWLE